MRKLILIIALSLVPVTIFAGNTKIGSFSKAKKILTKLYQQHQITFYCGCNYDKKTVDHQSCGYSPKRPLTKKGKVNKRAHSIEWEHIVPAHAFGQSFFEWREGDPKCKTKSGKVYKGRKCASKINKECRQL
jgi:deoxyribonuclease I